jgi:hypothetical protein
MGIITRFLNFLITIDLPQSQDTLIWLRTGEQVAAGMASISP